MNSSLRDLNRRADAVPTPDFDIAGIVDSANGRRRRRRVALAAGAAAMVAAVIAVAVVLAPSERGTLGPVDHPTPPVPTRSMTYTDDYREQWTTGPHWLIQSIQYGDQRLGLDFDAVQMDVTDDGVVLLAEHGGVYFADGSTVDRIGETQQQHLWASGRVDSGNAGSLVSWFTPATPTASLDRVRAAQPRPVVRRVQR